MTIKDSFSFKANKYFWINLIAMVVITIVLMLGVLKWLDIYTRHGEAVVVPDAKGMTVEEAQMLFRNHGLACMVSDSNYVKNKPAGRILELTPAAGQKVKEGRIIYLTINTLDIPLRLVPDVADNSSVRQAEAKVQAAGFKLAQHEMIAGERDWVYSVKYKGRPLSMGDKVPVGSTLTLFVGNGERHETLSDSVDVVNDVPEATNTSSDDSWF